MTPDEAKIGTRVRSLIAFPGVPKGTEGIIDEDYGTGVMVAWDLPDRRLPENYLALEENAAVRAIKYRVLRDGFDKERELQYLEVVHA